MVKIWFNRIVAGTKTYSSCPARYKEAVKQMLKDAVTDGSLDQARYDELILA